MEDSLGTLSLIILRSEFSTTKHKNHTTCVEKSYGTRTIKICGTKREKIKQLENHLGNTSSFFQNI